MGVDQGRVEPMMLAGTVSNGTVREEMEIA
jgi:hypothetical protein